MPGFKVRNKIREILWIWMGRETGKQKIRRILWRFLWDVDNRKNYLWNCREGKFQESLESLFDRVRHVENIIAIEFPLHPEGICDALKSKPGSRAPKDWAKWTEPGTWALTPTPNQNDIEIVDEIRTGVYGEPIVEKAIPTFVPRP